MASARTSDPQSWNRYVYALNNPLKYLDPDGLDVSADCAQDKKCTIQVNINVIYDSTVNNGKGFSPEEKAAFEKNQLARAAKDFSNSNIQLNFSYTVGSYTENNGQVHVTGTKADALNLVVSNTTLNPVVNGLSAADKNTGVAYTFINLYRADNVNVPPFVSVTAEHELGHESHGDPFNLNRTYFNNLTRDYEIDSRNGAQAAGVSQSAYREGLEPRRFAVPADPNANKPKT
jgi:hypothetical protein